MLYPTMSDLDVSHCLERLRPASRNRTDIHADRKESSSMSADHWSAWKARKSACLDALLASKLTRLRTLWARRCC